MKSFKQYILLVTTLLLLGSCDKDFIEINTNPYAVTEIDPALLFAGAQRTHLGNWTAEHTIVQQFVNPYNQGATLGFNFNEDIDGVSNPKWDQSYPGPIKNMMQAMSLLGEDTERSNLYNMLRIWKAQVFMGLVDSYGDVPYFDAGKAVTEGIFFPAYDDDAVIYEDLRKELTEAVSALNPSADYVAEDLFFGSNSENPSGNASAQVEQWKKLGNSLLLRLGMRYSKIDESKAQAIVTQAFNAGVMTSNADNAYVKYDGTLYTQNENSNLRNFSYFNYAAEPFVNQLKSTNDPRGQYILAIYEDPAAVANDLDPDTELANQHGVPVGVISTDLADPNGPYRGARGGGLDYSQMNIYSVVSPAAPDFWVTYAQTSFLLAEAAFRGWIAGNAQTYYENGVRADLKVYELYPQTDPITDSEIETYLAQDGVAYSSTDALKLINTQYWIANIRNGTEAFANFRRSGFPELSPNLSNNNLLGGFARRLSYPDYEGSTNTENYTAASEAMGGDNLLSRVFWDIP
ncbi:SusD/RagB family nutrient-binding outer membrane lipoprotein [Algoriphagus sp. AGSA1]|uniref:SusD/RagB family nutrient-binding outer membrane lipoprotein n=1 Tax=Algoriphagus sp. AGSA1 TaxID=2907213 RepID=UPI001F4161FD|nr:SusD/RagB family nutrient-binding outer membrane lipoprotein [Algoriphagus sp. AGSA1]MCE7056786.1 SusD/RagB family nutrient-binding outer membrane lipoprotein [Algoriphagus sp. AGSA1]